MNNRAENARAISRNLSIRASDEKSETSIDTSLMLDSGTISNMTPEVEVVHPLQKCNAPILFSDYSKVLGDRPGTRTVS